MASRAVASTRRRPSGCSASARKWRSKMACNARSTGIGAVHMTSIESLAEQWRSSGVEPGDTLLLHSNITRTVRTCRRNGWPATAHDILDSFLVALGPRGTLLLPLFNFDFTKGVPFDIRNTPSQMGALTEAGRLHPGAVRTGHPVYSFAAIGAQARRFQNVDNVSAFGEDSPFTMLRELDGKVAALDLTEF